MEQQIRKCWHLKANYGQTIEPFKIDISVANPSYAGLPPWMIICEQCSHDVIEAIRLAMEVSRDKAQGRGKSHSAQLYGHLHSLLDQLGVEQMLSGK